MRVLETHALWPIRKDATTYRGSFHSLLKTVKEMTIYFISHLTTSPNPCNRVVVDFKGELVKKVDKALVKANGKLVEACQPHLKAQAEKCSIHPCAKRPCIRASTH